jgi:hypothetical protein
MESAKVIECIVLTIKISSKNFSFPKNPQKKFKSASNQQTLPVFWTKITWRSAYEFTFNREDLEKIKKMLAQWKLLDENGLILRKFEGLDLLRVLRF